MYTHLIKGHMCSDIILKLINKIIIDHLMELMVIMIMMMMMKKILIRRVELLELEENLCLRMDIIH